MKTLFILFLSVIMLASCETSKYVSHRTCIECDTLAKDSAIVYTITGDYYYVKQCPQITSMEELVNNLTRIEVLPGKIIVHNNEMIGNTVTLYTSLPVQIHNTNYNIHLIGYCRYDSTDKITKSVISIAPFRYYRDNWIPPFKFDEVGAIQLQNAVQDSINKSIAMIPKYIVSPLMKIGVNKTTSFRGYPLVHNDSIWSHKYYKIVLNDTTEISYDDFINRN